MMTITKEIQNEMLVMTMEDLVPKDHLLRKIDKIIGFDFIYELVKDKYCLNNGAPSLDPTVLFKLVFIQYLFGIKSMRRTCEEINLNAAYRWFLGIPFGHKTPHFTTFSKNYTRRFEGTNIFESIFENIVNQAIENDLVGGHDLYTDSTHIKANASKSKYYEETELVVKKRKIELEEEINEEREKLKKKSSNTKKS